MFGVVLGSTEVLLIDLDGDVRAYRNRCPHQQTPLDQGWIEDGTLTCSRHMWEFDVLTGEGVSPRDCALTSCPVKVEDGPDLGAGALIAPPTSRGASVASPPGPAPVGSRPVMASFQTRRRGRPARSLPPAHRARCAGCCA